MGRTRSFDQDTVLDCTAGLFARHGYDGTSIDDVVTMAGLHRGSLYATFGSKRGLFRATLDRALEERSEHAGDLLLVALLELAPHDVEIQQDCRDGYTALFADQPARLGACLLAHAGLTPEKDPL